MIGLKFNIEDKNWKKNFPYYKKYIIKSVNETAKIINFNCKQKAEISFLLTSNINIQKLNFTYRNKNTPTNVLSFPMMHETKKIYTIGDIAISNEKVFQEAKSFKKDKYLYLSKITIHGVLHLFGYDHQTKKDFESMLNLENKILEKFQNENVQKIY